MESALALVHSRFSTNTFPSWDRAHPYRYIAHNGEINTLRGNINWMHARQAMFQSDLFGDDLKKLLPVINTDGSDSAMFDNCLELLVLAGRSLPHAIMMMIPEPWANHATMSEEKKAFYEYHSCLMEPWDGPASIAFTDGEKIGAVLDRNGLRPSRYYVTKDDVVIMASEVGVLDVPAERILQKGRLQPGRMFLVDTEEGRIVADEEIKHKIATEQPYRQWLNEHLLDLANVAESPHAPEPSHNTVLQRQQAFGYTFEDLRIIMAPMARDGVEAVGSMGCDTPLAVLSNKPQLLYNYFKQLFAQVTNPPIDCIREELVTSARDDHRFGAQSAQAQSRPVATSSKMTIADSDQRGIRQTQIHQTGRFQVGHAPDPIQGRRRRGGIDRGDGRFVRARHPARWRPGPISSFCPTAAWMSNWRPFRRCWRWRGCIIISFAKAPARGSAWCLNRANRAKSITFRCSLVTAPGPSIPTWPLKRSMT